MQVSSFDFGEIPTRKTAFFEFSSSTFTSVFRPSSRVQRKSVLQPAIRASCSKHVLAHKSFQLARKPSLISRIEYNPSVIWISPQSSTCPSGKLRTKITSPTAKSTSPGLSDTTFFARWSSHMRTDYFRGLSQACQPDVTNNFLAPTLSKLNSIFSADGTSQFATYVAGLETSSPTFVCFMSVPRTFGAHSASWPVASPDALVPVSLNN